jgi:hypothetical protein
MAINFAGLPDERPSVLPEVGKYRVLIEKAEMKTPKVEPGQPKKPDYLSMTLALRVKPDGTPATGKVYDNLSESDSDYVRYKIKRFIIAMGIPVTKSIELKDFIQFICFVFCCSDKTSFSLFNIPYRGIFISEDDC